MILLMLACSSEPPRDLTQVAMWTHQPSIEVCGDILTGEEVAGHIERLAQIHPAYDAPYILTSDCGVVDTGWIQIRRELPGEIKARPEPNVYAFMTRWTLKDGCYGEAGPLPDTCACEVVLPSNPLERATLHELIHCYGWAHTSRKNHLMSDNDTWYDTQGLEDYIWSRNEPL